MTNNTTFRTTAAPTSVRTRIEMIEHNLRVNRRQIARIEQGREAGTADDIKTLLEENLKNEGVLKGIFFMLTELGLHA